MTTAYRGFSLGAYDANHDVSSFWLPLRFRPKTCAVPVLPLIEIGKPEKAPVPVPPVTTSRSAPCRNFSVCDVAGIVPSFSGVIVFTTVPSVLTIALPINACQIVPPLAIAEYICANFSGVITVSP